MSNLDQLLQYSAWFIALVELIIGLYILVLNYRHTTYRYTSIFLLVLATNTFAIGTMTDARVIDQAYTASILLAMTTPAILPVVFLTSIALLKSTLLRGHWSWIGWFPRIVAFLPAALVLIDVIYGTSLWYTGLDPQTYTGGFIPLAEFTGGRIGPIITPINFYISSILAVGFLLYITLIDKRVSTGNKGLAWLLLVANLISGVAAVFLRGSPISSASYMISNIIFVTAYAYAAFQQMISEQRLQRGRLQIRLTSLLMIIAIPMLIAMALFLTDRARFQLEVNAVQGLSSSNHSVVDNTSTWLEYNLRSLENLVVNDDITGLDPDQQKPLLEKMDDIYPEMYLISTTNIHGINIARSDDNDPKDYSDRIWYQGARDGAPVTFQTLIGRTSGQPALVVSMPIYDQTNEIIGVGMYASDLDELSHLVEHTTERGPGVAYIVDSTNQLIAHPDHTLTSELHDWSDSYPVQALRQGKHGILRFSDSGGEKWIAYVEELDNGWGVIVEETEAALLAPVIIFRRISVVVLILAAILLFVLAWYTIRQGLLPIQVMTETAAAISAGDLSREVPIESEDELGVLARAFNIMTTQLRELITELESRIADRTKDLEKRAGELQVTADVAREAAAIRDLEELLQSVVLLISEGFGFYHSGIFMLSGDALAGQQSGISPTPSGYAVLRAANSEGGQRMLARNHKLKIGEVGIVGYVAATGEPRIALDVGADAVYFDNPDLPQTRSEMALPLKIQEHVIGVLDVQSRQPGAFSDEDVATLQILADQVALAIENSRLLHESQQAFQELEQLYGMQIREGWRSQLGGRSLTYAIDSTGIKLLPDAPSLSFLETSDGDIQPSEPTLLTEKENSQDAQTPSNGHTISVPIMLRGQKLGSLVLHHQEAQGPWTQQEQNIVQETTAQVALALENARLLQEAQRLANREQQINLIAAQVSGSSQIEIILQNTVRELGNALGATRTYIQIGAQPARDGEVDGNRTEQQITGVEQP